MDEHTLNDLLECSVCLERLDTSSKVLPCQHTFCRKCLEVIVSSRQELRCPECRILVNVKIDDLPPNVLLMRILEGMKNAAAAKSQQQQKFFSDICAAKENSVETMKSDGLQKQHQVVLHKQHQPQHHHINSIAVTSNSHNSVQQTQPLGQPQQPHQLDNISFAGGNFAFQRRCLLPHAYALFDFTSSEPTNLNFKKGDLVLLKRRIDTNWYVGQLNNGSGTISEGTFPINHVQVVVPLPSPQCIALYDFKMPPNEEQGCLIFKKGTIIQVLRRVDHNWAEGYIGSVIGIFPIAFVELNALAKQLLEGKNYPSTLPNSCATVTAASTLASNISSEQQQRQQQEIRNLPPIPVADQTVNIVCSESNSSASTSNSSSNTSSPHSLTTTITTPTNTVSGSSTSMPSSPNQSLPTTPQHMPQISSGPSSVRFRDKREKRHSLNALLTTGMNIGCASAGNPSLSVLHSNRHSAEILSVPSDISNTGSDSSNTRKPLINEPTIQLPTNLGNAMPQSTAAREQQQQQSQRISVLKTNVTQQVPPSLPWGYLALYPYKPRKIDELELKKGCVYIVTERCLDGWFKGKNWQDVTGVFPGNYVTPLRNRDQQQLMYQWKYVPLQTAPPTLIPPSTNATTANTLAASSTSSRVQSLYQPPDLPPRQISVTLPISSVWTKPLGQTVEAFFNRHSKTYDNTKENKEKDAHKQKEVSLNTNTSGTASSSSTSSAVQLMKRLAHMKSRSKSPSTAIAQQQQKHAQTPQYSMDNPTFEESSTNATATNTVMPVPLAPTLNNNHNVQMHPVHVRSGSCPSQLLQNLPAEMGNTSISTTTAQIKEKSNNQRTTQQQQQLQLHQLQRQHNNKSQLSPQTGYGSQQLKGSKERPPLNNIRQSMDGTTLRTIYTNQTPPQQHQPFQQFIKQQDHALAANMLKANHRKSQSLDTNMMNTAAPSNSAIGNTDVAVGSTAVVTPCTVTAAAIAASATTKSMQCARESRVRCVAPYPPNSDIELELQVGDLIYVQRKQKNGWYKGTHARTNKTGLFPASFVEPDV